MNNIISSINSIVALLVSIAALFYTAKAYFRKSGAQIRGLFNIRSSISCEDKYVGSLALENMKDRATVIFKIYLVIGRNYFVELEDFEEDPLILKPFEVYSRKFDPVDFYSVSMKRINLNKLISSKKSNPMLVLSTSEGRYDVKEWINRWNPVVDFFKNHMTAIIQPIRSTYKGRAYGSNVKYIVDVKTESGKEETIAIHPRDYEVYRFRDFLIPMEALESKEIFEEFLYEKASEGTLNCVDISVTDIDEWRKEIYKDHSSKVIEAKYYNWFSYVILGRLFTIISDFRLKRRNRRSQNRRIRKVKEN